MYGFDMRCIRDIAIAEPLVDNVNHEQICTEHYCVLTLDIMTMKKEAASFKVRKARNMEVVFLEVDETAERWQKSARRLLIELLL